MTGDRKNKEASGTSKYRRSSERIAVFICFYQPKQGEHPIKQGRELVTNDGSKQQPIAMKNQDYSGVRAATIGNKGYCEMLRTKYGSCEPQPWIIGDINYQYNNKISGYLEMKIEPQPYFI